MEAMENWSLVIGPGVNSSRRSVGAPAAQSMASGFCAYLRATAGEIGWLALLLCALAPRLSAQDLDAGILGVGANTSPPAHSNSEMLDHIEDVYGNEKRQEIEGALSNQPGDGGIQVGELFTPEANGVHDHDTILINTKNKDGKERLDAFGAAMVLAHEYEHAKRARDSGSPHDPETRGPCGACKHATMHYEQAILIVTEKCPADELEEFLSVRAMLRANHDIGDKQFQACSASLCPEEHGAASNSQSNARRAGTTCSMQ